MKFLSYKKTYSKIGDTFMMLIRCIVLIFAFSIFTVVNNSESVFGCTDTAFSENMSSGLKGFYQKNGTCGEMTDGSSTTLLSFSASGGVFEGFTEIRDKELYFNYLEEFGIGSSADLLDYYNNTLVPYYLNYNTYAKTIGDYNNALALFGSNDNFTITTSPSFQDDVIISYLLNAEMETEFYSNLYNGSNIDIQGSPLMFITFGSTNAYLNNLLILVDITYWGEYSPNYHVEPSIASISVQDTNTVGVNFSTPFNYLFNCSMSLSGEDFTTLEYLGDYYDCWGGTHEFESNEFVNGETYTITLSVNVFDAYIEDISQSFVFELPTITCDLTYEFIGESYSGCYENNDNGGGATLQIVSSQVVDSYDYDTMQIEFDVHGGRIYEVVSGSTAGALYLSNYEPGLSEKLGLNGDYVGYLFEQYNLIHSANTQYQYGSNDVTFIVASFNTVALTPIIYNHDVEVFYYYFTTMGDETYYDEFVSPGSPLYLSSLSPVNFIKYNTGVTENMIVIINKTPGNSSLCIDCGNAEISDITTDSDGIYFNLSPGINDDPMKCQISVDMTPFKYVANDYSGCSGAISLTYSNFFDGQGLNGTYYISVLIIDINNVYIYKEHEIDISFSASSDGELCVGYNSLGADKYGWTGCYINNNSQSFVMSGNSVTNFMYAYMNGRVYGGGAGIDAIMYNVDEETLVYPLDAVVGEPGFTSGLIDVYNSMVSPSWQPPTSDYPEDSKLTVVFARYSSLYIYADAVIYYDTTNNEYVIVDGGTSLDYSPVYIASDGEALTIIIDMDENSTVFSPELEVENIEINSEQIDFNINVNESINYDYVSYTITIDDSSCPTFEGEGYNIDMHMTVSCSELEGRQTYNLSITVTDLYNMSATETFAFTVESTTTYTIQQDNNVLTNLTIQISDNTLDGQYIYYLISESELTSYSQDAIVLDDDALAALFSKVLVGSQTATITLPQNNTVYYLYILTYIDNLSAYTSGEAYTFFDKSNSTIVTNDQTGELLNVYLDDCGKYYTQYATITNSYLNGEEVEFTFSDGYVPNVVRYIETNTSGVSFDQTDASITWIESNPFTVYITEANKFIIPLTSGQTYIYILTHQESVYNPQGSYAGQSNHTYYFDYSNSSSHTIAYVADWIYSEDILYFQEFGPYYEKTAPETISFELENNSGNGKEWTGFGDVLYVNDYGIEITYKFTDISYPIYMKASLYTLQETEITYCENNVNSSILSGNCTFGGLNSSHGLSDGEYLFNYQVWDSLMNLFISEYVNIVLDTEAPVISLDSSSVVTSLTTTVGSYLQAYIIGDNHDYDGANTFYYNSPLNYVPYLFLYDNYEQYPYIGRGGSYGAIKASSFHNYYLHVALDNQYDRAGNKIIGPECGSLQYCFNITSSDGVLGTVSVNDSNVETWDNESARVIVKNGFKFILNGSANLTNKLEFKIYDMVANKLAWEGNSYTNSDNEIISTSSFGGTINDSGELCLLVYIMDASSNLDTMLIIALDIDSTRPSLSLSDEELVTEITVTAGEDLYVYFYDDVDSYEISQTSRSDYLYYYASIYDVFPTYTFNELSYDVSEFGATLEVLSYSRYYLFVGIKQFTDTVGNSFIGDHMVCSDSTECDFGNEGVIFKFIINVSNAAVSNVQIVAQGSAGYIDYDEERTIYANSELEISGTTTSNAVGYNRVSIMASLLNGDFTETGDSVGFSITGESYNLDIMDLTSKEMGIYYIHINILIYSSEVDVAYTMDFYIRIYFDNEGPKLSLSPDEELFELSGEAGTPIDFYYLEAHPQDEEPEFKYFVSSKQYAGVYQLPIERFRDVKPVIMNTSSYYLYVLTRGFDLAGNILSNEDQTTYVGNGITNDYTDGTYIVIEFIVNCNSFNTSIDLINNGNESNQYGGQTLVLRDTSQDNPDMIIATINDCSTTECSAKDILEDVLNSGVTIGDIYQSVSSNAQGMTTNLADTAIFTTNNGNMFIPGIVMYSDDNTRSQIVDLMILNNAPIVSGSSNSGSSITINKGEEIGTNIGLSFKSIDGSKVSVDTLITFNGEKVKSVDTSKVGTYTVTQIATDAFGRKNRVIREITVLETEKVVNNVDVVEVIEEVEEIVVVPQPVNVVKETNTVQEEVHVEMERVELHIEPKAKFKGYSKKKMIKKNKKEQFSFKLFSKYFFKVYDG